jgi:colicin import membrane protein
VPEQAAPILQPLPEPLPEDSPVEPQPQAQQQIPNPDTVDQDEARRDALSELQAEREQERKRRQEQIDLTERQRQEEAEKRRKLSEMEQERQKQLEDIRRQRENAAREARQAEEKLRQIAERRASSAATEAARADAVASAPPGNRGVDEGLSARYAAALQEAILRNWTRPDNVPLGQRCRIVIRQIPGGQVVSAEVEPSCPYDDLGRRSIEAAVLKAQPLPYAGFESVFNRTLLLNFEARDR